MIFVSQATRKMEEQEMNKWSVKKRGTDTNQSALETVGECAIVKNTEENPEFMWYSAGCQDNIARWVEITF